MRLAPGYATKDFMIAYEKHISDRGHPKIIHSDKGSQLVAAGKEIEFEWGIITEKTLKYSTQWEFALKIIFNH